MDFPPAPPRTTPGFSFSIVQRCLRDCIADRQFGKAEMEEVVDFFGAAECVYCGATPIQRWDHLVAVSKGGDTTLGNAFPPAPAAMTRSATSPSPIGALSAAPGSPRSRGVPDIELLARFLCLAACISLNHRLGRPSWALVDYCA